MSNQFSPNGNIKKTLENAGLSPKKSLGQNFLHDANIINKMITAGGVSKTDVVLEIGPGLGTITELLAKNAKKVIAIETDKGVALWLSKSLMEKGIDNVELLIGDAIEQIKDPKSELNKKLNSSYRVVANIPYYITSHLIRLLLESDKKPASITIMIQKEVAERICSKNHNSLLSVSVSYFADAKINFIVSKNCFHPKPKVDSAVISLVLKKNNYTQSFTDAFFLLLKTGFSSPRKQILKNLTEIGEREKIENILEKSNIEKTRRAETLSLEEWKKLTEAYMATLLP